MGLAMSLSGISGQIRDPSHHDWTDKIGKKTFLGEDISKT